MGSALKVILTPTLIIWAYPVNLGSAFELPAFSHTRFSAGFISETRQPTTGRAGVDISICHTVPSSLQLHGSGSVMPWMCTRIRSPELTSPLISNKVLRMYTREAILSEIVTIAAKLGRTPGKRTFQNETGIRESDWSGRYWVRWSDAVEEAGLLPNEMNPKKVDSRAGRTLAMEVRRLGRFPTIAEFQLRRREDVNFPNVDTIRRRNGMQGVVDLIRMWCEQDPVEWHDVLDTLPAIDVRNSESKPTAGEVLGYVYLLRSGRKYKIGYTVDPSRRLRELNTGMPDAGKLVHTIKTDDPAGIEKYWHGRFAAKRLRSDAEWFSLSQEEVNAFRRRKFQ